MTSEILHSRIAAVRARHVMVAVFTGVALLVVLVVLWTAATMWLDWHVARGLPLWGRALSLALEVVAIGAIIVTRIIQPIMRAPDDEDIALMIEHEWPDFKTRLIASVQLTQPAALEALAAGGAGGRGGRSLVAAMVRQTEELADQTPVTDVIKTRTLNKLAAAAALLILLAVFLFLMALPTSAALLTRTLLGNTPLPTKTHIESVTGPLQVALGDPLKIEAKVSGYKPASGVIELTYATRIQRLPMERDPANPDTYSITLDSVQEPFKYNVTVYDGISDDFAVTALERPAVASFECTQVYPPYTGKAAEPCPSGELALLKGGKLRVKVLSTKPVVAGPSSTGKFNYILCFTGGVGQPPSAVSSAGATSEPTTLRNDKIPLYRDPKNLSLLTAEITLPANLNALSIHLVDIYDLESKDTAVYPVEMLPDRPPTVKIVLPDRKEVLETAVAKFEVGFLAEDDYLLGNLFLRYKVDEGSTKSIPLQVPPKRQTLRGSYLWDLARIPPPPGQPSLEGSVIEYWLDVEDTRTPALGGPGKGTSEHFAVRVVTAAAKQAELLARSGQTVGDIKEADEHQRASADKTVTVIKETPGSAVPQTQQNP
jgi:hypothetical protein